MDNKRNERMGEINYNVRGERMEIVDYIKYSDITVRFDDGSVRNHVHYNEFKTGSLVNHYNTLVYGVGISGYEKKKVDGKMTKEYRTWVNVLARCYDAKKQEEFPRYKGCRISDEWKIYDNFLTWCHGQSNWDKVMENPGGFHLDKDIIIKGNKIYGAEYCSFVPSSVNTIFTLSNKARGDYPIGVSPTYNGKYRSRCSMKLIDLPYTYHTTNTIREAFELYKNDKEFLIKEVAKREYALGNITEKCYNAMMNYQVEITD